MMATVEGQDAVEFVKSRKIPDDIKGLLCSLSEIRQAVLVQSPSLLPVIAPSLISIEEQVRHMY